MVDPENQEGESSDAGEPQVSWIIKWGAKGLGKIDNDYRVYCIQKPKI